MSAPRSSLRSFLTSARSNLQSAIISQQRVTLVIGNESADLDSITSAILFAYIRSNSRPTPLTNPSVNKHTPPSQYPPFYIPLLNIPRADIKIRPELLALLPHANLEPSHLITLDDLCADPPAGLNPAGRDELQPGHTRLVLTDHNKLAGPLAGRGFSDRVVGTIDHHVDERTAPAETGNEPRIIRSAGSCTSLVLDYCKSAWSDLSGFASNAGHATSAQSDADAGIDDAAVRRTWDAQVAKFALASILMDTSELKDQHKTEVVDMQAVDYLEAKIALAPGIVSAGFDREAFFKEISTAKKDLSKLSVEEVLRKDYKQWEVKGAQLGVSSVVQNISWQVAKAGGEKEYLKSLKRFVTDRKLNIFSIMTTSNSEHGKFQRELLMAADDKADDAVLDRFIRKNQESLGLSPWKEKQDLSSDRWEGSMLKVYWQTCTELSRKKVAPMMRSAIEAKD